MSERTARWSVLSPTRRAWRAARERVGENTFHPDPAGSGDPALQRAREAAP